MSKNAVFAIIISLCICFKKIEPTACQVIGSRPHILWLFADDMGYNEVGLRDPTVYTPNMDELAASGIMLTKHYMLPQCSPSRSAFLTGRYPFKTASMHEVVRSNLPCCLGLQYPTIPNYLKGLGYETHAIGKWHIGYCRTECHPMYRGFDSFYGGYDGAAGYYDHRTTYTMDAYDWQSGFDPDYSTNGTHSQDLVQERVFGILDSYDGYAPLFLYVAFHNPHDPEEPKPEFRALYDDLSGATESRKNYLGLISGMDYVIGEIIQKLKDIGEYDNTLIIFTSDNGGAVDWGNNYPWRGGKGSLWEGGSRVVSFTTGPLVSASGVENDGLLHVTDWFPTLATIAGGSVPEIEGLDGFDQSDLILNNGPSVRINLIIQMDREYDHGGATHGEMAVRNERYKLIWGMPGRMDGWYHDTDYIYNMDYYQNVVGNWTLENGNVSSITSGEFSNVETRDELTEDEKNYIGETYMKIVEVTEEQFESGTGQMWLFDLDEDPDEDNDLSQSTDPEHVEAKQELIKILQDAYYEHYKGGTHECYTDSELSDPSYTDGAMTPGWCLGLFPTDELCEHS